MRKHLIKFGLLILRLAVTAGLLGLLLARVDLGRMRETLSHANLIYLAASVAVLMLLNLFVAQRWRLILGVVERPLPYWALFRLMFAGMFFNQILPTGIGGDAIRAWGCHRLGLKLGSAVRSVLLDRIFGCAVLFFLSAGTSPILLGAFTDLLKRQGLLAVLIAGFAGLGFFFSIDRLPHRFLKHRFAAHLAQLSKEGRLIICDFRRISGILLSSAAGLVSTVLAAQLAGMSVGVHLSTPQWLAAYPLSMLLQLLPISIGGWGVREMILVIILGAFGVPESDAFAASLMIGVSQILASLPGIALWFHASGRAREISDVSRPNRKI